MSNYNISTKLIKKLRDDYFLDYYAVLMLLEKYNPSHFSTKYIYPQITNNENKKIINLGEIFTFNIEDLDIIFKQECSLKLEIYKIMKLKNQLYKDHNKKTYQLKHQISYQPYPKLLIIDIVFSIVPATGLRKFFKNDAFYHYIHISEDPYHFKNIYDFLLSGFQREGIECSEANLKSLNKQDFDQLMSIFDMISI